MGAAPIYLRITVEGKRSEVATGIKCDIQDGTVNLGGQQVLRKIHL